MKTRKFTRVISFILSIAFVFSTVAIKASAYSTETISYDCPKSLCTEDLVISGAYGDPDEIIDSEVPYFGIVGGNNRSVCNFNGKRSRNGNTHGSVFI